MIPADMSKQERAIDDALTFAYVSYDRARQRGLLPEVAEEKALWLTHVTMMMPFEWMKIEGWG
jgi:hypothetical protein